MFIRKISGAISHKKCMLCKKTPPKIDVIWADGRGRAWFCKPCFPKWKKQEGGDREVEVIKEREIDGEASKKWAAKVAFRFLSKYFTE